MTDFYAIIARYYDSEHADKDEDLSFFEELADQYGDPVLIIGSGTGRIALHLAKKGNRVQGIEIEAAMYHRAAEKLDEQPELRERLTLHHADALAVDLDQRFKLILIPYNTFMHFMRETDRRTLLTRCREWLADGGALVIDLPHAGDAFAAQDTDAVTLEQTFTDIETGDLVMQHSVSRLDRATQIMEVTWIYDAIAADGTVRRTLAPMTIRYFFLPELRYLLELCGLRAAAVYGDHDFSPYEDGAPRMIVVAE